MNQKNSEMKKTFSMSLDSQGSDLNSSAHNNTRESIGNESNLARPISG